MEADQILIVTTKILEKQEDQQFMESAAVSLNLFDFAINSGSLQ